MQLSMKCCTNFQGEKGFKEVYLGKKVGTLFRSWQPAGFFLAKESIAVGGHEVVKRIPYKSRYNEKADHGFKNPV
jgi:hypothetical protein